MKLTIELTDVSEYEKVAKTLLALHAGFSEAVVEPEVKPKAKKVKVEAAPEPVAPVPEPEATVDDSMAANPEEDLYGSVYADHSIPYSPSQPIPTQDQARDALSSYSVEHGMTAARALLEKYGAQRVSDIKDDQRAAFIAEMG